MNQEQVTLLKSLKERMKFRDEYLDKLPRGIWNFFIDNEYIDSLEMGNDALIKVAFGEFYQDAQWFLNEWRPGFSVNDTVFDTEESFTLGVWRGVLHEAQ